MLSNAELRAAEYATAEWFNAGLVRVSEFSSNIHMDSWRLLDEVNVMRVILGLDKLDAPEHFLPRDYFDAMAAWSDDGVNNDPWKS